MSKDAVKFGRMSKKQKAKVASELKAKNNENMNEFSMNAGQSPSSTSFNNANINNSSSLSSSSSSSSSPPILNSLSTSPSSNTPIIQQQAGFNGQNGQLYHSTNLIHQSNSHHLNTHQMHSHVVHPQQHHSHQIPQQQQFNVHYSNQTHMQNLNQMHQPIAQSQQIHLNGGNSIHQVHQHHHQLQQQQQQQQAPQMLIDYNTSTSATPSSSSSSTSTHFIPQQTQMITDYHNSQRQLNSTTNIAYQQNAAFPQTHPNGYHHANGGSSYFNPQHQQPIQSQALVKTNSSNQSNISQDLNQYNYDLGTIAKQIFDAHSRTFLCYFDFNEMNRLVQQHNGSSSDLQSNVELQRIMGLTKTQLYLELADKLTSCVQQIIDFSKMVPGFMQLLQDDQIALLKSASYGIMLLYAAQSYIPERNCFIYNQQLINVDMFMSAILNKTQSPQQQQQQQLYLDDEERYFIQDNFEFIRQIKQFNLSNTETALLSAIILFNSENNNLNDQKSVYHNNQRFIELLRMDIENNRSHQSPSSLEKQQMLQQLLNLVSVNLRRLTQSHFELIKSFKINNPSIEFPPLHRELFNVDYYVYCHQQQQMQLQQQQQLQPIGTNMQMVNRFSNSAATGASSTTTATAAVAAANGVQYSNYPMMQQVQNVNKSSPSPSSCSSASSSSRARKRIRFP